MLVRLEVTRFVSLTGYGYEVEVRRRDEKDNSSAASRVFICVSRSAAHLDQ